MMHGSILVAGLFLGLDSFLVSVPLGATRLDAAQRRRLALAFAVCDGGASLLGWITGMAEWCNSLAFFEWLGPVAVGCYGIYALGLAWYGRRLAEAGPGRWMAISLPLCLSLDNLVTGVGTDASAIGWSALAAGAVSGCLALCGLRLVAGLTSRIRPRAEWLVGAAMVAVSLVLLGKDALT